MTENVPEHKCLTCRYGFEWFSGEPPLNCDQCGPLLGYPEYEPYDDDEPDEDLE